MTDLENLFQGLIAKILNLSASDANDKVRISWPTSGAPDWKITDDICFIRVNNQGDDISQQFDTQYADADISSLTQTISNIEVHRVDMVFYGPNSWDNASIVRKSLYAFLTYKEYLAGNNLAVIPGNNVPVRAPELFNGRWWERADLYIMFNELVKTVNAVMPNVPNTPNIKTINITENADGAISSVTITNNNI